MIIIDLCEVLIKVLSDRFLNSDVQAEKDLHYKSIQKLTSISSDYKNLLG
jgi:hypothetical protein